MKKEVQDISGLPIPQTQTEVAVLVETVTRELVTWWREAKLENLTPEQLVQLGKRAVLDKYTAQMAEHLRTEAEDVPALVQEFLRLQKSEHTRKHYKRGLRVWLAWCEAQGVHPLRARARDADLFAATVEGTPSMVNQAIGAASAWYRIMLRWERIAHTPFTQVSRRLVVRKPVRIPTEEEVAAILAFIRDFQPKRANGRPGVPPEILHAAVAAMAWRGFRVGALPGLTIDNGKYTTVSKGKNWASDLLRAAEVLRPLGRKPFAGYSAQRLLVEVRIRTQMMVKKGLLSYRYSAHTFRHHFASVEYSKDKNVLRVSRLLNHNDVAITTRYLHEKLGFTE